MLNSNQVNGNQVPPGSFSNASTPQEAYAFLQQQQQAANMTGMPMPGHQFTQQGGSGHLHELADIAVNHERLPAMANNLGSQPARASTTTGGRGRLNLDGSGAPSRPQRRYGKICTVCGDKALGYNFDAISCESCKAFFRRNATKIESLRCAYNDNCQIDQTNRKLCRRCRLRKCFRVGMRIEYIQSEEQKQRKREIMDTQRKSEDEDIFQPQMYHGQPGDNVGNGSKRRPSSTSSSRSRTLSPPQSDVTSKRGKSESGQPFCIVPANANELTVDDCQIIDEAVNAWKSSLLLAQETDSMPTTVSNGVTSQEDLLNVSEISFRRMVSMFKKVQLFRSLDVEDQKALLRGGALDLLIMRSALTYNPETHMFLDPTDDPNYFGIHSSELRRMADNIIVDGLVKLIESLKLKLQVDDVMLILLLLITLFSDDRPELNDRSTVGRVQERYSTALQHYILTVRATSNGACNVLFADLIVKLRELRSLSTTYETVVPFLKQWAIKPLMRELLHLNMPHEEMTRNQSALFSGQRGPSVDEDLLAAQQLFHEHNEFMATRHYASWAGAASTVPSTSSTSEGPMSAETNQQMSPVNPASVLSNSSFGLLSQYDLPTDLPSVNASELP